MRGGELILPLTTTNLALAPRVFFLMVVVNSSLTGSSLWRVFSFVLLGVRVRFALARWISALNWCSSITLISVPLSDSTLTLTSSICIAMVLSCSSVLILLTCLRCLTAWQKNSSSELVGLLEADSSVVFFKCFFHSLFFGCFDFGLWFLFLLPALNTAAKWLNRLHFEHLLPYAGQFFPAGWVLVCPHYSQGSFSWPLLGLRLSHFWLSFFTSSGIFMPLTWSEVSSIWAA